MSLIFDPNRIRWVRNRDSVAFQGTLAGKKIEFLITTEALAELLNPKLGHLDAETAMHAFAEFEQDIYRIAEREFRRSGDATLVLIEREALLR